MKTTAPERLDLPVSDLTSDFKRPGQVFQSRVEFFPSVMHQGDVAKYAGFLPSRAEFPEHAEGLLEEA